MLTDEEHPVDDSETESSSSAVEPVPDLPPAEPVRGGATKYRVTLLCPTPLVVQYLEVEAEDEEDAKAQFNAANGISKSFHPYKIDKL